MCAIRKIIVPNISQSERRPPGASYCFFTVVSSAQCEGEVARTTEPLCRRKSSCVDAPVSAVNFNDRWIFPRRIRNKCPVEEKVRMCVARLCHEIVEDLGSTIAIVEEGGIERNKRIRTEDRAHATQR